jgi:glycosyltransferase involved in cell wall biosynthesis
VRVGLAATLVSGPESGAGRRLLSLAPALADRGVEVVLFVSRWSPPPIEPRPNLQVVPLPIPPRPTAVRSMAERFHLPRAAREAGVAILDSDHVPIPPLRGAKTVATVHDLRALAGYAPADRRLVARQIYRASLRRAAAIVAVSRFTAGEIERRLGVTGDRIAVVPNAGDHLAAPEPPSFPGDTLVHVGHLEPRKHLDLLVEAFARVVRRGFPLRLALAGREGTRGAARHLLDLAARLGVRERVRIPGPVAEAELPRLYASCLAAVFPSVYEGFGIPLLEAMRCGAPVLASRAGAHPEVAGDAALFFEPDDEKGLAEEIERIVQEPATRERLREAGK